MRDLPHKAEMERATYSRDASYDGIFYVCVRTTRIFCWPSCAARKPLAKNMLYRRTVRDCLLDGYRPCKRCRPLATNGAAPGWLDVLVARVEQAPCERLPDAELRTLGINPYRARRYFLRNFDMTFQAYHRARRMGLALEQLRNGNDALAVGLDHGYESQSGFREAFERTFGTTAGKSAGLGCIRTTRLESPIGPLVAGATDEGVCMLEFADGRALRRQVAALRRRLNAGVVPGTNAHLDQLGAELSEYFDGQRSEFTVALQVAGTEFQKRVWNALRQIPFGRTCSYADIAEKLGRPTAVRAVGRANGDNPVGIIIPCHRVVASDGTLCGYGGGLWRKRFLLELEGQTSALLVT